MSRRLLVLLLVLPVALTHPPGTLQAQATHPELEQGIEQVREGDFGAAVVTLDGVARKLAGQKNQSKVLARTYVYLSIAYLGLSQVEAAKTHFLEALNVDRDIELTPREFPPRFMTFFEETMKEVEATEARPATPPPETTVATPGGTEPKGRSKWPLALLGAGAGVGAAVALAGGGGGSGSPAPAPTPPPNPSATVSSPQDGTIVNCTRNVYVVVTVRNPTSSALSVSGITGVWETTSGGCDASAPFTYVPRVSSVGPGSSEEVFNTSLYGYTGCGCCRGECDGSTCGFRVSFSVNSSAGAIPAGSVTYSVQFSGCVQCSTASGPLVHRSRER